MAESFQTLLDSYFDQLWQEHPEAASSAGLTEHAHRLGEYSAEAFARRDAQADAWAERFAAVGDDGLEAEEAIDRDLVLSEVANQRIRRDWAVWRRNPATYLSPGLSGVFDLFLHRLLPEPELADAAASRLRQVPAILEDGKANLDPELASPIFVERALAQCSAASTYVREVVPGEVVPDHRAALAEAGEEAGAAFDDFLTFLEKLQPEARGPYAIGEQMYSRLLQEREMLGYGAEDMRARGKQEFERLSEEMRRRARDLTGSDDWPQVMRELNADHPATPEQMRTTYEEWCDRARDFLIERDLVTMPEGEVCKVVPSPPFQRSVIAVASYSSPPALTGSRTGHFFVPYPPDGVSDVEVAQRLESNSFAVIPTVSVHEAYPGHHWHLVMVTANARRPRKLLGSSYFSEGWALYVEMMMLEQGFYDDPRHELGVMDARIFRAARIIIDTSLHIGDMSYDEAVAFLVERTGMAEPTARAEVGRYCSWPTQAPSYLTGCLEIERMREGFGGSLKQFHDRLGSSGMLPIALAERALQI